MQKEDAYKPVSSDSGYGMMNEATKHQRSSALKEVFGFYCKPHHFKCQKQIYFDTKTTNIC